MHELKHVNYYNIKIVNSKKSIEKKLDVKFEKKSLKIERQNLYLAASCAKVFLFASFFYNFFVTRETPKEKKRFQAQILYLAKIIFDKDLCDIFKFSLSEISFKNPIIFSFGN